MKLCSLIPIIYTVGLSSEQVFFCTKWLESG